MSLRMIHTAVAATALSMVAAALAPAQGFPTRRQEAGIRMVQAGRATKSAVLREWKGFYGGNTAASDKVVRTPAEWAALWRQAHANQVPPPAAPKVDFASEMVIAVFMGQRPTGGYAVTIQEVAFGEKEIRVTVREATPPPDAILTQALTQPFHMVVVKKSALPVRFVRPDRAKSAAPGRL